MTDNNFCLGHEKLKRVEELKQGFPKDIKRSLILPTLWMVQEEYGYIPQEAAFYVASLLSVPVIWVQEVQSWYSMLNTKKVGKYHIQICHNLSCALRGAEELIEYLKGKLGIAVGETTPDGKFSLGTVECLCSCGTAPAMQINEKHYENLTKEKIDQILVELK